MIGFKQTAMIVLLAGLAMGNTAQSALLYNITDLGTLGGYSYGFGINASGQVTGYSAGHAFITSPSGVMSDLGTLNGNSSAGLGINDSGQVTGYSLVDGTDHAFITSPSGVMSDLGTLSALGGDLNRLKPSNAKLTRFFTSFYPVSSCLK